ncbi:hypothetical protein [Pseudomonas abietaniphila]|uniref:hypothetical protein n=1 Tax=Pseudomonas abietaniphila TaxID=89065 RepID=UPI0013B008F2|nr:hypothetical protein [Pseudomonas abietaniphila]
MSAVLKFVECDKRSLLLQSKRFVAARLHYNTVKSAEGVKIDACSIQTTVFACVPSRVCRLLQARAGPVFMRAYDAFCPGRLKHKAKRRQKVSWMASVAQSIAVRDFSPKKPSGICC